MSSSAGSSSKKAKHKTGSNVMFTNAVYFPSHRLYRGASPGALNYSCISIVYYGFARVFEDGGVFLGDEYADMQIDCDGVQGGLGSLMHLKKKHPHLQVVLSVGGGASNEIFPLAVSDAVRRDNFARSARGLVEASGLDGIDIYWEYPCDPQQGADFLSLLAAIRIHLPDDRYLLTAALPTSAAVLQNIDLAAASQYLDLVNLVAFDFVGPWSSVAGHHAQLYATQHHHSRHGGGGGDEPESGSAGVARLMQRGVPAKKILLGIPLYGRSFLHCSGPGHGFRDVGGEDGAFDYADLPRRGTSEQVDKRAVGALCVGGDGGFVSYDNPESVKAKAAFVKQKGLAGLFYWDAPADAKEILRSLIATGFRSLHSS